VESVDDPRGFGGIVFWRCGRLQTAANRFLQETTNPIDRHSRFDRYSPLAQGGNVSGFKLSVFLGCCLILPLVASAEGSFWMPQAPKQRLAISTWANFLQGDLGVVADYSLGPDWSAALLHRFGSHYPLDSAASYGDPANTLEIDGKKLSYQATGDVNNGGFDVFELRRRFSHQNTRTLGNNKRVEYYGALGIFMYHGFSTGLTVQGERFLINEKLYENSNLTVTGERPPFKSLSVGAGVHYFLVGSWFTSLGFTYPLSEKPAQYQISSTDPNVSREELDQQLPDLTRDSGVGSILIFVLGYAF